MSLIMKKTLSTFIFVFSALTYSALSYADFWSELPPCPENIDVKNYCVGSYVWENGDKYEGTWKDNKRQGKGTMIYGDSKVWHGLGSFTYTKGDKYVGWWDENKKSGEGVFIYANGDRYEGKFKNDYRSGHGVLKKKQGESYEGAWKEDALNGYGVISFPNGDLIEGEFKKGALKYGGTFTYSPEGKFSSIPYNGIIIELKDEYFKDGISQGPNNTPYFSDKENYDGFYYGTIKWPNGNLYRGYLKNEIPHYEGSMIYPAPPKPMGSFKEPPINPKYEGSWKMGKRHGKGTMLYKTSAVYEDEWKSGNSKYIGEWKNDKRHGKGEMIFQPSEEKYIGEWKNDEPNGKGSLIDKSKKIYKGIFGVNGMNLDKARKIIEAQKQKEKAQNDLAIAEAEADAKAEKTIMVSLICLGFLVCGAFLYRRLKG